MAILFIKEVPEEIHRKLKDAALQNRRSMGKQALVMLEEALERASAAEPARAKRLPRPFKGAFPLTDEFIQRARREGRM